MKALIQVEKQAGDRYRVTVSEAGSRTSHLVTGQPDYCQKLTGGRVSPETLVQASFEFLLARESKESILREFDLPVIARYFSEYEDEIKKRLAG
ncbi:MAG: hypothetical protein ACFFGP_15430 [Promethearchaeota archaeon]